MTADPWLFYGRQFSRLRSFYEKQPNKSSRDVLNAGIVGYLADARDPIPDLDTAEKMMREEVMSNDVWPIHPSWSVLMYNRALVLFRELKFYDCSEILQRAWEHQELIEQFVMICFALLTVELSIRAGVSDNARKAVEFVQERLPKLDSILASKNQKLAEAVRCRAKFCKLRYETSQAVAKRDEEGMSFLKRTILAWESVPAEPSISLFEVMPMTSAALCLRDNATFKKLVGLASNLDHFAIANNQGVLEMTEKKYASAVLKFSNAIPKKGAGDPSHRVLYNIGLCLLSKDKPKRAFPYFYSIIDMVPDFPYLWLRLAECCCAYFKQRVAKLRRRYQLTDVIARRLSTVTHTYTVLPMTDGQLFSRYRGADKVCELLTLEFGEKCARKAMNMCNENQVSVQQSASLLYAYMCLEMGDAVKAEQVCSPMKVNNSDPIRRFFARIYGAQACFVMRDYAGALDMIKPILIETQLVNTVREHETMLYQTAGIVVEANNDSEKAIKHVNKCLEDDPKCWEAVLTKVAGELSKKKIQNALALLDNYGVRDAPGYGTSST